MNRAQLNLALLGVAAALGATLYFGQKKEEKAEPLLPLAADAIDSIVIDHPSAQLIKLEKKLGHWFVTAPVLAQADPYEVNGAIALATAEVRLKLDAAQARPLDLGLQPAAYDVSFNGQKVEIGGVEPLKYRRYVRAGGHIALIDDPPSAALDADYSDLVSKNLVGDGERVIGVQMPGLALTQSDDGKTLTLAPDDAKATTDQKRKLLDTWQHARAMWNAMGTGEAKGDSITLKLADRELKFIVAERDPQLVLVRPDLNIRYTMSKELVDTLLKLPEDAKREAATPAAPASPGTVSP